MGIGEWIYIESNLYHLKSADMWNEIVDYIKSTEIFCHILAGSYGVPYSHGTYHGLHLDAVEPPSLLTLSDNKRFEIGYALADAFAEHARSCIKKSYSIQRPWPKTAQYLQENDPHGFAEYRDTFYSFVYLSEMFGKLALLIFKGNENKKDELKSFLEKNGDISSFLHYLSNFGHG